MTWQPVGNVDFTGELAVVGNVSLGGITSINPIFETLTVSGVAATGTINYDLSTNKSVTFYTTNASGNWTLNIRGNSTTTLNSIMPINRSLTIVFMVAQGGTAFFSNSLLIDGTATGVTTRWQTNTPAAGNINSIDVYSYTILKTAASPTYTVLASLSKFS